MNVEGSVELVLGVVTSVAEVLEIHLEEKLTRLNVKSDGVMAIRSLAHDLSSHRRGTQRLKRGRKTNGREQGQNQPAQKADIRRFFNSPL